MSYGTVKVDTIIYTSGGLDATAAVSGIANGSFPNLAITGTVSGATVTGNSGQFGTITGGIVRFANVTGVSGTFTTSVSGATVTGNSGQFGTITGASGLFATGLVTVLGAGQTTPVTTIDLSGNYSSNINAVSALNINCSSGVFFTKTVTSGITFTVSNVPASRAFGFTLEITHTSGTITWFSGVEWPGGTAPTLTTGKTHLFGFVTDDGGTRWRGIPVVNYTN